MFDQVLKCLDLALLATTLTLAAAAQADWVRGHFRSNGTYVDPYCRTPANGIPYDNLSYRGYPSQQPGYVSPRSLGFGSTSSRSRSFSSGDYDFSLRGNVYLNGEWLAEAPHADAVMKPAGPKPMWFSTMDGWVDDAPRYLLNIVSFKTATGTSVAATKTAARHGTQDAPSSEGGQCVGFISHGCWLALALQAIALTTLSQEVVTVMNPT